MTNAKKTQLGKNGPIVSAVGFGAMGMSDFYGKRDDEENLKVLNHAIDIGCTFWDTADMYGCGANEKLIAKVLKTRRSEVFLCTKFGIMRDPATGALRGISGKPDYVKKACQDSLDRLGVEHIDLYYQHRVDKQTPIEETVKAMAELVKEGKVKYLGLSEASAATIRRAHAVHPITAYQGYGFQYKTLTKPSLIEKVEYSPWTLDIEQNDILSTCKELGIAVIPYSPLGRGFLTGALRSLDDLADDDWRRHNPRFQGENFAKNLEIVDALKALAERKGCTVAQLTLAWVMKQAPHCIPIPGTTKSHRLDENWGATDVTITDEDEKAIREVIARIPVVGTRYPEAGLATCNA
ncbi:hypothetical protein HK101_002533 [Irineochytrium annulatum]|nr:hypothetical protein HK101_002533 [Irineochytrium annulatum]